MFFFAKCVSYVSYQFVCLFNPTKTLKTNSYFLVEIQIKGKKRKREKQL